MVRMTTAASLTQEILLTEAAMDKAFKIKDPAMEQRATERHERLMDDLARTLGVTHAQAEAHLMERRP